MGRIIVPDCFLMKLRESKHRTAVPPIDWVLQSMNALSVQCSAQPPAKKTAGLTEKETDKHRTSNIELPTSNNVFCRF